jgi:hypothetical protein
LHSKNMLHGNLKVHHSSLSNSSVQTFWQKKMVQLD